MICLYGGGDAEPQVSRNSLPWLWRNGLRESHALAEKCRTCPDQCAAAASAALMAKPQNNPNHMKNKVKARCRKVGADYFMRYRKTVIHFLMC